jgi:hypothetical protein
MNIKRHCVSMEIKLNILQNFNKDEYLRGRKAAAEW